jgi:hypothetical protein
MRRRLTEDFIIDMCDKAKNRFYLSERPSQEKEKLKRINPIPYLNDRLRSFWGRAYLVNTRDSLTYELDLRERYPYTKVEGRMSWFILEINPSIRKEPIQEVYDTVSHELAHLLDFCFTGYYTRLKGFHHKRWKDIHKAMGGSGMIAGVPTTPWS